MACQNGFKETDHKRFCELLGDENSIVHKNNPHYAQQPEDVTNKVKAACEKYFPKDDGPKDGHQDQPHHEGGKPEHQGPDQAHTGDKPRTDDQAHTGDRPTHGDNQADKDA